MSRPLKEILAGVACDAGGNVQKPAAVLEEALARLVSFDTTSSHESKKAKSTVPLTGEIAEALAALGAEVEISDSEYPKGVKQAALVARIGPDAEGGLCLSGHLDTVPAGDHKKWASDPFTLARSGDALTGRGAVDMKGAIASFLITAAAAKQGKPLTKPLYLALSWGEEIGCKGAGDVTELMKKMNARPDAVLIGEPTGSEVALAHKGALNVRFTFRGIAGHSGYPKEGVGALDYGVRFMTWLKELEMALAKKHSDTQFDPPEPIVNLNNAQSMGNDGPNAVDSCFRVGAHIRPTPGIDIEREILNPIRNKLDELRAEMETQAKEAPKIKARRTGEPERPLPGAGKVGIDLDILSQSPGLSAPANKDSHPTLTQVRTVYHNTHDADAREASLAFGSDGGVIAGWLHTVRPQALVFAQSEGSMAQNAHNPNEYITDAQLQHNLDFHTALANSFCRSRAAAIDSGADKSTNTGKSASL